MNLTYEEMKERLKSLPEPIVLELLEITSDEIVDRFEDKIEEKIEYLREDLENV